MGTQRTIALSSDHAGFDLKSIIAEFLTKNNYKTLDLGPDNGENSVDYPDYGHKMAHAIETGQVDTGIIICGSGIGISIAANRSPDIRAALCHNAELAKLARQHNDANVLALGARVISTDTALECVSTFLNTEFEGGRHQLRLNKLNNSSKQE